MKTYSFIINFITVITLGVLSTMCLLDYPFRDKGLGWALYLVAVLNSVILFHKIIKIKQNP